MSSDSAKEIELEVRNLCKYFPVKHKGVLKAVDHVSFQIQRGETLGIVGESGCGKTTCGKTCIGMYEPQSGEVLYQGKNIHKMSKKERFELTSKVQMIFQDPYASLDPHQKVYDIIAEGMDIHHMTRDKDKRRHRVEKLLEQVGLDKSYLNSYVNTFSGGQRQRIGIARALAVNPKFIVCDEPISALDVSVQAQIVNLLKKLQKERNISYLFIAHDLAMVKYISDRIGVMKDGKILELAEADELYNCPLHPYTISLLSASPLTDLQQERKRRRIDYDPATHRYPQEIKADMYEIGPEHFIYCSEEELPMYKQKYAEQLGKKKETNS